MIVLKVQKHLNSKYGTKEKAKESTSLSYKLTEFKIGANLGLA